VTIAWLTIKAAALDSPQIAGNLAAVALLRGQST